MDFLLNILSHWESALAVLLVLGGLIFFHELGHFAVARLLNRRKDKNNGQQHPN